MKGTEEESKKNGEGYVEETEKKGERVEVGALEVPYQSENDPCTVAIPTSLPPFPCHVPSLPSRGGFSAYPHVSPSLPLAYFPPSSPSFALSLLTPFR